MPESYEFDIKVKEKYLEKIDKSIAWRKKEITEVVFLIKNSSNPHELLTRLRMGYVMIYSHWEGIIKNITIIYLDYINKSKIEISALEKGLVYLHLKKDLKNENMDKSKSWEVLHNAFHYPRGIFYVSPKDSIPTQNLNYEKFIDYIIFLGLDSMINIDVEGEQVEFQLETKKNLINERLVNIRNKVAHGERGDFNVKSFSLGEFHNEIDSFLEITSEINILIEKFKEAIIMKIMEDSFLVGVR